MTMTKLTLILISIILLTMLTGCAGKVDEKVELAEYNYQGTFRGIVFYSVRLRGGAWTFVGIKEGEAVSTGEVVSTTASQGKMTIHSVFINGKSVSIQEAKALLNHE